MPDKKTLTIGVTINLGNYESLRMEVSSEVEGENGAALLSEYLDTVLAGYGKGDEAAKAAIDRYRQSILTHKIVEAVETYPEDDDLLMPQISDPPVILEQPSSFVEAASDPISEIFDEPSSSAPLIPEVPKEIEEPKMSEEPKISEEPKVSEEPAPILPKPEPVPEISVVPEIETPKETVITAEPAATPVPELPKNPVEEPLETLICEKCGAEISKVQRDVSHLFMGKSLCKACMK